MDAHKISKRLTDFEHHIKVPNISVQEIMDYFEDRSIAFFLFLFALPAAIPLPGLGINLVIALPLVFLTLQQVIQKERIWLPRFIREKTVRRETLVGIFELATPWVQRLEVLLKPRFQFLTGNSVQSIAGILSFAMALFVCIPLPLTNTVPSFAIALMCIGILTRDGMAVVLGALVAVIWGSLLTWALIFLGVEGLDFLKETIKSFI